MTRHTPCKPSGCSTDQPPARLKGQSKLCMRNSRYLRGYRKWIQYGLGGNESFGGSCAWGLLVNPASSARGDTGTEYMRSLLNNNTAFKSLRLPDHPCYQILLKMHLVREFYEIWTDITLFRLLSFMVDNFDQKMVINHLNGRLRTSCPWIHGSISSSCTKPDLQFCIWTGSGDLFPILTVSVLSRRPPL